MHKGQIFSLDFLFALILVIIFLGTIVTHSQIRAYAEKENILNDQLLKETDSAVTLLLNGVSPCEIENEYTLANSIDKNNLEKLTLNDNKIETFKENLGVIDKNISIIINNTGYVDEINSNSEDIIVYEREIITCNKKISIDEFNEQINGSNTYYQKEILIFKVSK